MFVRGLNDCREATGVTNRPEVSTFEMPKLISGVESDALIVRLVRLGNCRVVGFFFCCMVVG